MTNKDFSILKRNINTLMEKNHMTQQDLADLLGMSQSNVSKCLKSDDDSRRFTLEQVCTIAQHFEVSLDELVGRKPAEHEHSAEDICKLFAHLIRKYQIVHFKHQVEEEAWIPSQTSYDCDIKKMIVDYDAFYFPNYVTPPKYLDEYRLDDFAAEARAVGNDLPANMSINNFLQKFIDAFEKYDSGVYNEEDYNILVDAYFRILKK